MIHVADKLLILERGEVLDYGPPRALIEKYGATLTSAHHIGLPQVTLAALGARRAFGSASLPLTVQEFASWVLKPPQHGAAQPRSPEVIGTGQALARPAVVDAEDVSYAYPRAVNQVVKKVSLRVQEGEVVAILGKNGSGKSTLARLLVGLLKPRQGVIRLGNRDVAQLRHHDIHRLSGYVFQYPEHQFLTNSVQDEIGYGLEVQSVPRAEQQRIIADVVASLGLAGLEARHPFTLSGGEKRRLSVATMLVLEPRLLILDEPTYGLDEGNVVNLVRLMFEQLRHRGITFLFITHDMRLVAEYADRALVMHHGELVFDGAPKDLFRDSALLERSELLAPPVVELTNTLAQRGLAVPDGTITVLQLCQALNWVYAQESEKL
jgi:energy-coupling factor transport system ATP-binding protein